MDAQGSGIKHVYRVTRIERRGYYTDVVAECEEEAVELVASLGASDGILCFADDDEIVDVHEME